jgi:hypothetical protein
VDGVYIQAIFIPATKTSAISGAYRKRPAAAARHCKLRRHPLRVRHAQGLSSAPFVREPGLHVFRHGGFEQVGVEAGFLRAAPVVRVVRTESPAPRPDRDPCAGTAAQLPK